MFRKDGGANSIAGIDLDVQNIVAIFAQWGLEQLLLASLAWLALLRYRGLIPLILLINLLDNIGRILVGRSKPLKIDLDVDGGQNIVAIFAQWGLEQLLLAASPGWAAPYRAGDHQHAVPGRGILWQSLPKRDRC